MNTKSSSERKLKNKMDKMIKKKSIWRLSWYLGSKSNEVASIAGLSLGQTGDERAIKVLFDRLNDEWRYTREAASRGLSVLQNTLEGELQEDTINFLFKALKDKKQCIYAQNFLEKIGQQAVKQFIYTLKEDDIEVKRFAISVLGKIKVNRAVDPLIELLKDKDIEIRRLAVIALGNIKDKKAEEHLINALKDKDSKVRNNAANALDLFGWRSDNSIEIFQYLYAKEDWNKLKKLGNLAIDPLIAMLKDTKMRSKASQALKQIGEQVIEPLMTLMNTESENVKDVVMKILASIDSPKVEEIRKDYESKRRKERDTREKKLREKIEMLYHQYLYEIKDIFDISKNLLYLDWKR